MNPRTFAAISLLMALIGVDTPSAAQPAAIAAPVVVDSVINAMHTASQDQMTGYIQARHELTLMARQAGELTVLREAGEVAAKGDLLAQTDSRPLELRLTEQKARLRRSEVALANIERRIQRVDSLDQRDFVATNELDDLREQRDVTQADIAIAHAQIDQLKDQISRTQITAPYAGVVIRRDRNPGEYVTQGSTLGAFVGTEAYELRVQVPLSWQPRIHHGSPLSIIAPLSPTPLIATVRTIIPAVSADSQSFEVRADLPHSQEQSRPVGQLVQVEIPSEQLHEALMVPRDALVLRRDGARVVRITADNTAEWVPVSVGQGFGEWIAITGELRVGQKVAVRGAERLAAGQAVEVLKDLAQERALDQKPAANAAAG